VPIDEQVVLGKKARVAQPEPMPVGTVGAHRTVRG
jgi:hypothetical protein